VNIGIINKNIGTVSNLDGNFKILMEEKFHNDSLKFSSIGYESKTFLIADFIKQKNHDIQLDEVVYQLSEVKITSKKYKLKRVGDRLGYGIAGSYGVDQLGHEFGIKVELKGKESILQDFNFFIAGNQCDTLLFRLNIYSIKDSLPDKNLLMENIFVKTAIKKGYVKVDLQDFNICLKEDFVITLEWIKEYDNKDCIYFRFRPGFSTVSVFGKVTSQGTWKETKKYGIEFYVTLKQ